MLEGIHERDALIRYLLMGDDFKQRPYPERREIYDDLVRNSTSLHEALKRFYERWYEGG